MKCKLMTRCGCSRFIEVDENLLTETIQLPLLPDKEVYKPMADWINPMKVTGSFPKRLFQYDGRVREGDDRYLLYYETKQ